MLQKHSHYNDLSDKLRSELESKALSFGKKVRVKFNIARDNPDPQKYNGDYVYPNKYTLDPRTFRIVDPYEDRKGVSKSKEIGLVNKVDREGIPETFHKIVVEYREQGIKTFDVETNPDDLEFVMYLLMHPKLKDGKFQDKDKTSVLEIIDEQKEAKFRKERRDLRRKALNVVAEMKVDAIIEFADAMGWDSTEDPDLLKDKAETLAETNPELLNDLISGKSVEYQATIKRALDRQIIGFDPAEYKFIWTSNQQPITILSPVGDKGHVEKLSEWLQAGGSKADEIYKKIKGLVTKNS